MKYKIEEKEDGIDIKVEEIKEKKEKLLDAFRECQEGRCSCPTEEYKKLESLEIEHGKGCIQLRLKSKEGTKIDKSEINRCLEYTSARIESE
jgi:hypothetical protein